MLKIIASNDDNDPKIELFYNETDASYYLKETNEHGDGSITKKPLSRDTALKLYCKLPNKVVTGAAAFPT